MIGSSAHFAAVLHFKDFENELRFKRSPDYLQKLNPQNILYIPLLSKGELLGVIEAIDSKHDDFNKDDVYIAEAISNHLTMMLENFNLFSKLQNQFIQVVEALADAIGKKER